MEADESLVHLLNLFSYFWFENQIFKKNSIPPFVSKVDDEADENDQPKLARISTSTHADDKSTMMSSQESLSSGGSDNFLSPNSVLMIRSPMKLETILSGKESSEVPEAVTIEKQEQKKKVSNSSERLNNTRRRRKGKGLSTKSLSELEFEELKGFMDLGFVFSEEDKNSKLAEIIPALQRFGKEEEDKINSVTASIKQPYLSQAWEDMEYRRKAAEKLKLKINAAVDNEMDMKHQLRFWAHSVASAIK